MMDSLLETERLLLRPFTAADIPAIFTIYSDVQTNRFLPWFPLQTRAEAAALYRARYAALPKGAYRYAVCLKSDPVPVGYVHISEAESRDLGYALLPAARGRGVMTEACRAVIAQLRRDGVPFVTATHDRQNGASGRVMQRLGMRYCYSYEEQWMPKDIPVVFRMYQLNLDGCRTRVYEQYRRNARVSFVETDV